MQYLHYLHEEVKAGAAVGMCIHQKLTWGLSPLSISVFFFLFLVFNWLTGPGLGEIPEGKGPTC